MQRNVIEDNHHSSVTPLFELKGIIKQFPGVRALDDVSIKFGKGQVHAILGENGAGKSTLIKCIVGIEKANDGEFFWDGEVVHFKDVKEAYERGISVIYQELSNVGCLSVAENMFIGNEIRIGGSKGVIDWKAQRIRARKYLDEVGCNVDINTKMETLGVGQQQLVEIARAMERNAKLIIMDEPTASLSQFEIEHLLELMLRLKKQGVSIIFITHKLDEAKRVCDVVTVIKDGKKVGETMDIADVTEDQIISMMVGRSLKEKYPSRTPHIGKTVMQVNNLSGERFTDISFEVKKGELLGIFGLVGAGRTELARVIFGADERADGEIIVNGTKQNIQSPQDAIRAGIAYLTEDRKINGLVLIHDVVENVTIAALRRFTNKFGMLNLKKREKAAQDICESLNLRPLNLKMNAMNFSGGNQQKIVLGRWMIEDMAVYIFDEPTKGVDVGAKTEIYSIMNKLLDNGAAVIMITSEMEELLGMSDRVMTMYLGRKTGELINDENITEEQVMVLATGGKL